MTDRWWGPSVAWLRAPPGARGRWSRGLSTPPYLSGRGVARVLWVVFGWVGVSVSGLSWVLEPGRFGDMM